MATHTITYLPLRQLHRSALNVRKTGGMSVEELTANIAAHGLIQNLVVTPEKKGRTAGYGVVAGGRRLAALQALVRAKTFPASIEIPCAVVDAEEAVAISLAENVCREAMHPADQYEAFAMLVDAGKSDEDIAAAFGVSAQTVQQRLRLARVSPAALALYRDSRLNLDQVMALTLTDDHARQDALLSSRNYYPSAYEIRRTLTETAVRSDDPRAKYVGESAYTAAGGLVRADLFDAKGVRYFEDAALLQRLAAEKLQRAADKRRETFAWIDVLPGEFDYSERARFAAVPTVAVEPDAATAKRLKGLRDRLAKLDEKLTALEADDTIEDEAYEQASDKLSAEHDTVSDEIATIEAGLRAPDPAYADKAGAVLSLGRDGRLVTTPNLLRAEDAPRAKARATRASTEPCDGEASPAPAVEPSCVRTDLTTYLTAVTQEALAARPDVALRALAFRLASEWQCGWGGSLGLHVRAEDHADLPESETLAGSTLEAQRRERQQAWEARLPTEHDALWAWCLAADDATVHQLLAYCTARMLKGVLFGADTTQPMQPLMAALGVDMAAHWTPNAGFFKRIRKAATLDVLAEHGHRDPALAKAKRDALAERAGELLAGTGWLPAPLRIAA